MKMIKYVFYFVSVIVLVALAVSGCRSIDLRGNLDKEINSKCDDFGAVLIDDNLLIFTSNKEGLQGAIDNHSRMGEDIFYSLFENNKWQKGELLEMDSPTTILNEGVVSIMPNGNAVIGRAYDESGYGGSDLYSGKFNKSTKSIENLKNLGGSINTKYWEAHPTLFANGNVLIFASDRPNGIGGSDLYISFKKGNDWTKPENLGKKFNTVGDEYSPFVYMGKDTILFYASSGRTEGFGNLDIYYSYHKCGESFGAEGWSEVKHLDGTINSGSNEAFPFFVSPDKLYFACDSEEGFGGYDLYQRPVKLEAPCIKIEGLIVDNSTKTPIKTAAEVLLVNNLTGEKISKSTVPDIGEFEIPLLCPGEYKISVTANKYEKYSAVEKINTCSNNLIIQLKPTGLLLTGIVKDSLTGEPVSVKSIVEFRKDGEIVFTSETLPPESKYEIDKIMPGKYEVVIKFPEIKTLENNQIIGYWTKYETIDISITTESLEHLAKPFEYPIPDSIPYFVTGYYRPNTTKNLKELENLLNGKLKDCEYIERPGKKNKHYGFYRDYAEKIENILEKLVTELDEKVFPRLLNEEGGASKIEILIQGYTDPRNIMGKYVEASVESPNISVKKGTVMSNPVLSELRAYYTMKHLENLLMKNSKNYKKLKESKPEAVKFIVKGKGPYPKTNIPFELQRQVGIYFIEKR